MALIELHPQLKETNSLLERIAKALERQLLEEHNVRLGHCVEKATDPNPEEKPSITYHTDEDSLRNDLLTLAGRSDEADDSEDEFGV